MNKALSDNEISQELQHKARVVTYDQLANYNSIEELLHPWGRCVILYPTGQNVGHWTCVFYSRNNKGTRIIEFFDPYGISVDREFRMTRQSSPHYLAKLLYKTRYDIEYNDHRLQAFSRHVQTCGRHVINRLRNAMLPLDEYYKIFGPNNVTGLSADALVTRIT